MVAAFEGNLSLLKALLASGSRVTVKSCDRLGRTALHWAIIGTVETPRCLRTNLRAGSSMNACQLLVEQGASIEAYDKLHWTPAMVASMHGHVDILRMLFEKGAQVNSADRSGTTALMWACSQDRSDCVDLLLNKGAKAEMMDVKHRTAVFYAASQGATECIKVLVKHNVQINAVDEDGRNILHIAVGSVASKEQSRVLTFDVGARRVRQCSICVVLVRHCPSRIRKATHHFTMQLSW